MIGLVSGSGGRSIGVLRALAWAVLGLALAYLAWRGVWRAITDSRDLAVGYAAARSWFFGYDPYDVAVLKRELLLAGGGVLASGDLLDTLRNVYFPTTLPVFLPIAFIAWPDARLLALAMNIGAAMFIALGLVRVMGWRWTSNRSLGLIAFVLALGPLHLTMSLGQTGILATAGIVAAILLERSSHGIAAGVLYGVATAVKIQIGLPFVAYLLWRRRWATAAAAGLVLGGVTLLSVLRMEAGGSPWYDSWQQNLAALLGPGGVNDAGPLNAERYSLINLQYPLLSIVPTNELGNLITFVAVGTAALATVWLLGGHQRGRELLALSIVAVLGLLVTYHRYYDAVLLALPIAWAFSALGTASWRQGVAVLVLCLDFVAPILGALVTIERQQILPTWLTDNLLWEAIVLPLHTWVLVLIVLVLLWAAAQAHARAPGTQTVVASAAGGASHDPRDVLPPA